MKIKHTRHYDNYLEAVAQWKCTIPSTIHSKSNGIFIVEWETDVNSGSDLMREFLVDIRNEYALTVEQIDALDFADSAIKTLIDMGVIK